MDKKEFEYLDKLDTLFSEMPLVAKLNYFLANPYKHNSQSLFTPLKIPQQLFEKHFEGELNNPQFTYWFLKFNAQQLFKHIINSPDFVNKINSGLRDVYIKSELSVLEQNELKAQKLLHDKELDIQEYHRNNFKYSNEVELLRILHGNYYKKNATKTISALGVPEVQFYCKHILLKPYLQNLLDPKAISNFGDYSFENIFNEPEYITTSLSALMSTEPAVIDKSFNYLLGVREKGSITAWVHALRKKGFIRNIKDANLAIILNKKFIGLNLGVDGRTLRNPGTTAYKKYYSSILNLL